MPAETVRLDFEALGTSCHLFARNLDPCRLSAAAAQVGEMQVRLTRFQPTSELSLFNAAAGTGWRPVSPVLEELLRAALDAHRQSGGLVNCAVLPSMLAIGYTRSLREGPTDACAPQATMPLPTLPEVLEVGRGRARLLAGAGLDLGGLAKGWLADRIAQRWLGEDCLVNLGGDLFARGPGPQGEGWPVGMGPVTVLLKDQGAATSATTRRRWVTSTGRSLHHLIDPRTGLPAVTDAGTVSVIAGTALAAEVAAKTGLILGSALAPAYLAANTLGWWML